MGARSLSSATVCPLALGQPTLASAHPETETQQLKANLRVVSDIVKELATILKDMVRLARVLQRFQEDYSATQEFVVEQQAIQHPRRSSQFSRIQQILDDMSKN